MSQHQATYWQLPRVRTLVIVTGLLASFWNVRAASVHLRNFNERDSGAIKREPQTRIQLLNDHEKEHRHRHLNEDPDAKFISRKEQKSLLSILTELQRSEEDKQGLTHHETEEEEVDLYFEDDIMLTTEQARILLNDYEQDHRKRRKRKLDAPLAKRWDLPIAFTFDGKHNPDEKRRIYEALAYWQELTCIDFIEDPMTEPKLLFVRGRGCWSYVGFTNNPNQTLSIGEGCQSNGTIAHEVGHAIGFWHEHTRPDRDEHVFINKYNVTQGKLYNFDKRTWGEIVTLDIPYDLGSDMHYGSKFYSKDENSTLFTMETIDALMWRVIGQRQELSFYDVKLANRAYCQTTCENVTLTEPCRRDGYQDPRDCKRCRCPDGFGGMFCEIVEPPKNAYCGGMLDARWNGSIFSPNYPLGYSSDIECSWLISAPRESHVYFKFIGDFGVAGHTDVCKDFVEVRYNSSLALTGARFCCDKLPTDVLMSDTHEMLVLFRSYRDTRVCDDVKYPWKCQMTFTGFQAVYWTHSCGGCQATREESQAACTRRVQYSCEQSWQEQVPMECPRWWYTSGCGTTVITRTRTATCYRDQYYCCDDYQLQDTTCQAMYLQSNMIVSPTSRPSMDNPGSVIPMIPSTHDIPHVMWSDWSDWGICSRSCGGGYMQRTRNCIARGYCGTIDTQVDQRPCNQQPCYRRCPVKKRVLCDLWTTCTKTVYESCHPYCYAGYQLYTGKCVPSAA